MANLELALQLRHLALTMAGSKPGESIRPKLVYAALQRLRRARPLLRTGLRLVLSQKILKQIQKPKLKLWTLLAQPDSANCESLRDLLTSLSRTEAWKQALDTQRTQDQKLILEPWNYRARLNNIDTFMENLKAEVEQQTEANIFFWHHFDRLGYVPLCWKSLLLKLRSEGWIVVISSSGILELEQQYLEKAGCLISQRQNLGLCLGAYRDFCCLLNAQRKLRDQIKTLVLCNDSTLPLGGAEPMSLQVEKMRLKINHNNPKMIGLTDSVQTRLYHIQSYFLMINSPLLQNSCWGTFWGKLKLKENKDDIIQEGEVGLTQWLLQHNISLDTSYSLTSVLLNGGDARTELEQLDLRKPDEVNLTLMCWKALLRAGFPLIKKQLLLDPPYFLPRPVPMSELFEYLGATDVELIEDLAQLMRSRFHTP